MQERGQHPRKGAPEPNRLGDAPNPLRPNGRHAPHAVLLPDLHPWFRPLTELLVVGLLLLAALRAAGSVLMLHAINVVHGYEAAVTAETQLALDSANQLVHLHMGITGPLQVSCMVAFVGWHYALARSSAIDPRALRRAPRWHLLAFYTPIVGLWWPAQNLRDLYAGALAARWPAGQAPRVERIPLFVAAWWGLRLLTTGMTHLALVFSTSASGPVQTRQTLGLLAVAFAAGAPAAVAAAYAAWRVSTTAGVPLRLRLPV